MVRQRLQSAVAGLCGFRQSDGCHGPEHLRQRDALRYTGAPAYAELCRATG